MEIGEILKISFEICKKYPSLGSKLYIETLLSQKSYIGNFKSKNVPLFNLQDFLNDAFELLDEEDISNSELSRIYDDNISSCNDIINNYEKEIYEYLIDKYLDIPYKDEERENYKNQLLNSKTMLLKLKNKKELNIENLLLKYDKTEVISTISLGDSYLKKIYITLSFTIPLSQIKRFMLDFTKFCIKNNISCIYSSKIVITNDMVKIIINNPNDIDKVIDFVKKYKESYSKNPFINKYNDIGIISGNIKKYNSFVSEQIYNYVKNKKSIEKITEEEFRLFLKEYISKIDENCFEYTNFINLNNILNFEEFNISIFKDKVEELDKRISKKMKTGD